MIQNGQLCLVASCAMCNGNGHVSQISASVVLSTAPGYGIPGRIQCPQCVNGFVFQGLDEMVLLRHLVRLLAADQQLVGEDEYNKKAELRKLRQELREVLITATEERVRGEV